MTETAARSTVLQADGRADLASRSTSTARLHPAGLEVVGVVGALALGLVALAHLVLSARSTVFFYSGDSVLLPLVEKSVQAHQPFEWAMSSVLFFVPEIPVYLAIAAVVPETHAALLVNALVIVVGLYLLLRGLVGVVGRRLGRATRILLALAPVAMLMLCTLLEHSAVRASLELVTLFLTTTYYYGTTLAMVAAFTLTVAAVATPSRRRRRAALVGLVAVSALATFSNPLFVLWATGPGLVALAVVRRRRLTGLRRAVTVAAGVAGGALVGDLLRIPFARFISHTVGSYIRVDEWLSSAVYFVNDFFTTASTWQGAVEMTLLSIAVTATLAVAVVAVVRRWPARVTLGLAMAAASMIVTVFGAVVGGTHATRYLMPLYFAPAVAAVFVGVHAVERLPSLTGLARPAWLSRPVLRTRLVACVTVVAAVAGLVSVQVTTTAPSTQTYSAATCVSNWVAGRNITGAGEFWTIRALQTYGDSSVRLLQVGSRYTASIWLDNAADFRGQDVSYLVTDSKSSYATSPQAELGAASATVRCGAYTIHDYAGTVGETTLTHLIATSAAAQIEKRGLGSTEALRDTAAATADGKD